MVYPVVFERTGLRGHIVRHVRDGNLALIQRLPGMEIGELPRVQLTAAPSTMREHVCPASLRRSFEAAPPGTGPRFFKEKVRSFSAANFQRKRRP